MLVPGASHSSLPVSSDTLPLAPPAFSAPPPKTVSPQPKPYSAAAAVIRHRTPFLGIRAALSKVSVSSVLSIPVDPKALSLSPQSLDSSLLRPPICNCQPHSPTLLRPDLSLPSSGLDVRVVEFFHSSFSSCRSGLHSLLSSLPCDLLRSCLSS